MATFDCPWAVFCIRHSFDLACSYKDSQIEKSIYIVPSSRNNFKNSPQNQNLVFGATLCEPALHCINLRYLCQKKERIPYGILSFYLSELASNHLDAAVRQAVAHPRPDEGKEVISLHHKMRISVLE
jgi:hypothetical protein